MSSLISCDTPASLIVLITCPGRSGISRYPGAYPWESSAAVGPRGGDVIADHGVSMAPSRPWKACCVDFAAPDVRVLG